MAQERIYWVDNLKGVLLLLVIVQHVFGDTRAFVNWYLAFHMSAFFFLSGYLYVPTKYKAFSDYARSKWHSLLKPYFLICLFFSFFDLNLWIKGWQHEPISSLDKYMFSWLNVSEYFRNRGYFVFDAVNSMIQGHSVYCVSPMWFLWALCGSSLLFHVICSACNSSSRLLFPATIILGGIGWMLYMQDFRLPFNIDVVITSTFFYGMGFLSKSWIRQFDKQSCVCQIICILVVFLAYLYGYKTNGTIGINAIFLGKGNCIEYVLGSLGGVLFVSLTFCTLLKKRLGILSFVAKNAIVVLAVHMWVLYSFDYIFPEMAVECRFLIILLLTLLSIPLFNKYLYFLIGKEKQSFAETLTF